ncbi:TonB-dependent receptor domain-containing protein [Persicobacter diffluens]|uniref:TonB-dependent receptor-like beta-barrel domain-containing protein n=1 Tax=Persicobacter diffluens TaxID=981 RepID=A0AAN4VZ79_9BACT|nr:hypothetical protein PEDI_33410 [Persicobacter diffluens]
MGLTAAPNPDLRWESAVSSNLGVDLGLLDDRILFNAEYYKKRSDGFLAAEPIPDYVGIGYPTSNLGIIDNQGIELMLQYRKKTGDFHYDISANAAYNHNRAVDVENENGYINSINNPGGYIGAVRMETGMPFPFFYGFQTDGIFQTQEEIDAHVNANGEPLQPKAQPGDIRFVDVNGDGSIDEDDRTDLGSAMPSWTFGATFNASYKNWDFSIFFQGQAGNKIANLNRRRDVELQNYNGRVMDRWHGPGTSNEYPRMTVTDPNNNYLWFNDMVHLEDGSYLRLKNLQVGYTIPMAITEKVGISRLRLYVSGQNLLTWTNYTGLDPELGSVNAQTATMGLDRGNYPQSRIYMMGVNITF